LEEEVRYVYYGESNIGRLLALVIAERKEKIRVVTAYDLDAGQKRDYLTRRLQENRINESETEDHASFQKRKR